MIDTPEVEDVTRDINMHMQGDVSNAEKLSQILVKLAVNNVRSLL